MIGNFLWICSSCVYAPTTEDLTEMTPKKELQLAYRLAGILLVVGIFCYAASSTESPSPQFRYKTDVGNVLFDHKAHFSPEQYGISCEDCHHHDLDNAPNYLACNVCHQIVDEDQSVPEACLDCHDLDEIEGTEMSNSSDAAHEQCKNCHDQYGAGPVECNGCHVK